MIERTASRSHSSVAEAPLTRLELRTLRVEDEASFRKAVTEFTSEGLPWDFAFAYDPSTPFAEYVSKLDDWSQGRRIPDQFVPNTFFVGVVDDTIVGRVSLRHRLNDWLAQIGGHIGYGVVPSCRGRGHATEMLRQVLLHCPSHGIERALLSCDEDNFASRKVIERNGGVFESHAEPADGSGKKRRYWIDIKANGR